MRVRFHISSSFLKALIILLSIQCLLACSAPGYYTQAIKGHFSLMASREPIDKAIEKADDNLKRRLLMAKQIKRFAVDFLALPESKSYSHYVALKRDYPAWNIIAAQEFSLQAKQWCYLIVGCANYRGYYRKKSSEKYANSLREKGYDVRMRGVPAYSTLGYFADPLTSTMLERNDARLAELLFHEISHQRVYVKGDSRFNEAFASAVGELGTLLWLEKTQQNEALEHYKKGLAAYKDFIALVAEVKDKLHKVYRSDKTIDEKRKSKKKIFSSMHNSYETLKEEKWGAIGWYDHWFKRPVNNARLIAIATYHDLVPEFIRLFERCERNFSRFYQTIDVITKTADKNLNVACSVT